MRILDKLTIRSKLIVMLLTASSISIGITAYVGYQSGRENLTERVFGQLTSLRAAKANQIESYMETIRNQAKTMGEDLSVQMALVEFAGTYRQLENAPLPEDTQTKAKEYYSQNFLPRLAQLQDSEPVLESYLPTNNASSYLQHYYLTANPNPVGEKQKLDRAEEFSGYSEIHARYHSFFRSFIEKFGYYDLFLIDPDGTIVYSVFKETDYATNLETGPYRTSNLAQAASIAKDSRGRGFVKLVDFEPYRPSYNAPAAFIATPIYQDAEFVGVLALQLPVDNINSIMTGDGQWRDNGLGESGETYLVGSDYLMRSISRFLIEDRDGYLETLRSLGVARETLEQIQAYDTSILLQTVKTQGAEQAIGGKSGTQIINDYREIPVLSSYTKLEIPELDWAILAEIDLAEAYAPIYEFRKKILIAASVVAIGLVITSMGMAYIFVRPIERLVAATRQVERGETTTIDRVELYDELGDLVRSFDRTIASLQQQKSTIEQQNFDNERLVLSVLPQDVAQRLKEGEKEIVDRIKDVTVIRIHILGLTDVADADSLQENILLLHELIKSFDKTTEIYTIDKVKTVGNCYVAACGLSNPYLDGGKRAIDFALSLQSIAFRFSHEKEIDLDLKIGIHYGDIIAGIIGQERFLYDIWGHTVDVANSLTVDAAPGKILVSQSIFDRLHDLYEFESRGRIEIRGVNSVLNPISAWQYKGAIVKSKKSIQARA